MFIQLVKVVMFVMHIWYPILGAITNLIITALWIVSVYGQAGPDHTDPHHKSNVAWYIGKSCSYADPYHWGHYCKLAKATFAVSVIMMTIFFLNFLLGVFSIIPSRASRAAARLDYDDNQDSHTSSPARGSSDKGLEMQNNLRVAIPEPYTPRTTAFNTLSGTTGGTRAYADRKLPFRDLGGIQGRRTETPKLMVATA